MNKPPVPLPPDDPPSGSYMEQPEAEIFNPMYVACFCMGVLVTLVLITLLSKL